MDVNAALAGCWLSFEALALHLCPAVPVSQPTTQGGFHLFLLSQGCLPTRTLGHTLSTFQDPGPHPGDSPTLRPELMPSSAWFSVTTYPSPSTARLASRGTSMCREPFHPVILGKEGSSAPRAPGVPVPCGNWSWLIPRPREGAAT